MKQVQAISSMRIHFKMDVLFRYDSLSYLLVDYRNTSLSYEKVFAINRTEILNLRFVLNTENGVR